MTLSGNTQLALLQCISTIINANIASWDVNKVHRNRDIGPADAPTDVSPAKWNAQPTGATKQLYTAIKGSAEVDGEGKLKIQIWLGYDVRPQSTTSADSNNNTDKYAVSAINFNDMRPGLDATQAGVDANYGVIFKSGTTPDVEYFATVPGGSKPAQGTKPAPLYPVYKSNITTFPVDNAGTMVAQ
jgi:hypothetical protein